MGLGTGIALLVIGGILAFGVRDSLSGVDLTAIGYVCMGAGASSEDHPPGGGRPPPHELRQPRRSTRKRSDVNRGLIGTIIGILVIIILVIVILQLT